MKRAKTTFMKRGISILLSLTMLALLLPARSVLAETVEDSAAQKEESYRQIIIRDVPECTWTSDTEISHTTELCDPEGNVNGYIYEYENDGEPAGYLQLDLSMDGPVLDCYCFGGEHPAAKEIRELPTTVSENSGKEKVLYLGGYSYFLLGEENDEGLAEAYDVMNHNQAFIDCGKAAEMYQADVSAKEQAFAQQTAISNSTMSAQSANTITKLVPSFGGLTLATYTNMSTQSYGCGAICGTNICMYWSKCRGKTGLFTTSQAVYDNLKGKMDIQQIGLGGGTNGPKAYNGLKAYVAEKGYSTSAATYLGSGYSWNWIVSAINAGHPVIQSACYNKTTQYINGKVIYVPEGKKYHEDHHFVAVFGYQYIDVVNTLIIADCHSSSTVYKAYAILTSQMGWDGFTPIAMPYQPIAFYVV